jgi:uncharacterized protein YlxP (DUF503 family)
MIIGILKIDLHLPGVASLKQKRMILKSMKDRVRKAFNVSIAELDNHDKWQVARMGIAAIGTGKSTINSLLDKVVNFLSTCNHVELTDYEIEII